MRKIRQIHREKKSPLKSLSRAEERDIGRDLGFQVELKCANVAESPLVATIRGGNWWVAGAANKTLNQNMACKGEPESNPMRNTSILTPMLEFKIGDLRHSWCWNFLFAAADSISTAPVPEPLAEKISKKLAAKVSEKKGKTAVVDKEVLLDPVVDKLLQQRLVEEADYKSTAELFAKSGDEKSLDNFIPKSENVTWPYFSLQKSFHYIGLLKAIMRLSTSSLKAADAKEVASSVTAIANEKLKVEKEANAGKKKTAKKKQLHVDKADDDVVVNTYDALDDDDFIISSVGNMLKWFGDRSNKKKLLNPSEILKTSTSAVKIARMGL
ncbi:hypothetical protein HHK36_006692 [Tetracentron sinense]|uniref:Eukaryotic translation initiation factor 3 30 kDa subunit n=1 Tax=Tetracentron sinense TaxID=13715 RepID=A0A834ZLZ7_TETSI|nr:hypothetical protein HHK36_006692 [Tetracentron sinense]